MLEQQNEFVGQDADGFYDLDDVGTFSAQNRNDIKAAGGWAFFLGVLSVLGIIASLLSFNGTGRLPSQIMGLFLISTVMTLVINGVIAYWCFIFSGAAREIGRGSDAVGDAQKLSGSVLAIFRIFGIFMVVSLLLMLIGLIFSLTEFRNIF
ncbi:MAG: hypothetical protein AAF741_03615 [Bacteroidota bacterium]